MMKLNLLVYTSLITVSLLLTACQPQSETEADPAVMGDGDTRKLLVGPEWEVKTINEQPLIDREAPPTITFDRDGQVAGSAGCNRYSGAYEVTGEGVSFGHFLIAAPALGLIVQLLAGRCSQGAFLNRQTTPDQKCTASYQSQINIVNQCLLVDTIILKLNKGEVTVRLERWVAVDIDLTQGFSIKRAVVGVQ